MFKFFVVITFLWSINLYSQTTDCFKKLDNAFSIRGSYPIDDGTHKHVIISFFTENGSVCYEGRAKVSEGMITSFAIAYVDDSYEPFTKKFFNSDKTLPLVKEGISELITTEDNETLCIIFVDKLRPKKKGYKEAELPEDL